MSMEIGTSYNSYYTQSPSNGKSNVGKTTVNNESTTSEIVSKEEYFSNISSKYPNANMYMSNSYTMKKNDVTFNFSPGLIAKAMSDPKAAKNLNRLVDLIPATQQEFSKPKYTIDGRKITGVSFVVDENGGMSCKIDVEQESTKNTRKTSDDETIKEEKLHKRKLEELKEKKLEELNKNKKNSLKGYEIYNNRYYSNDINLLDKNM